ncbi:MAG: adenosine deaminase, partial [Acidimicrobiia bacterium]
LEVCPTSNIRTGVATGWDEHPIHQLIAAGVNVTISSDDPALFDCSVASEFRTLSGYGTKSMEELTMAAIQAAWATEEERQVLVETVRAWWADN